MFGNKNGLNIGINNGPIICIIYVSDFRYSYQSYLYYQKRSNCITDNGTISVSKNGTIFSTRNGHNFGIKNGPMFCTNTIPFLVVKTILCLVPKTVPMFVSKIVPFLLFWDNNGPILGFKNFFIVGTTHGPTVGIILVPKRSPFCCKNGFDLYHLTKIMFVCKVMIFVLQNKTPQFCQQYIFC